jgi:beta-N-acetylhexosaminidase
MGLPMETRARRPLAAALVALALVMGVSGPTSAITVTADAAAAVDVAGLRPKIVKDFIPFGDKRKRQTAAYSNRHYGEWTWHLTDPQVIVEHYTDGTSYAGAWSTFASNAAHLGEKPGTCAHFVVDRDGTIYQLVPLWIRCRHAVGMNYTSIGIEHVGTSDRMVLDDRAEMHASLRLTLWLMAKFQISIGNVNGHRETLESPFRYELYPSWQCLVHADFPHWAMHEYRQRLRDLAARREVPVGPGPHWVNVYDC